MCALKQLFSPVNMFFYSDVRIWLEDAAIATASFILLYRIRRTSKKVRVNPVNVVKILFADLLPHRKRERTVYQLLCHGEATSRCC